MACNKVCRNKQDFCFPFTANGPNHFSFLLKYFAKLKQIQQQPGQVCFIGVLGSRGYSADTDTVAMTYLKGGSGHKVVLQRMHT